MKTNYQYLLRALLICSALFLLCETAIAESEKLNFRWRANVVVKQYNDRDTDAEIRFGRNLAARILSKYQLWQNEKAQKYVQLIGTATASQSGRSDVKFYFAILDTNEINAFAIPGGYIFLTKGALLQMENEAQLIGTLAHEIAHINQRHVVDELKIRGKDSSFLSSVSAVIGGPAVSGLIVLDQLLEKGFSLLFEKGMEKDQEFSADKEAIQTLVSLGYDWKSYPKYLEKIGKFLNKKEGKVLSKTHPPMQKRVLKIQQAIQLGDLNNQGGKKKAKRFYENVKN